MSHDTARWIDDPGPSPPDAVPLDALFDALAHPYRRRTLSLLGESQFLHLDDVVAHVAAAEASDDQSLDDVRSRVAVACHHVHLPRLDDAGLVTYDPGTRTVSATDATEAAEPLLEIVSEQEDA